MDITSWRAIADQLTAAQVAEIADIERRGNWDAVTLLAGARYYASLNCEHVTGWPQPTPAPPGCDCGRCAPR
jgi:hypothetical protein